MKEKNSYVEFTPPKGFVPPEGTDAGKTFDMVCTFEVRQNGEICMTKLGDTPMPKQGEKEGEEAPEATEEAAEPTEEAAASKPDYSQYAQGIMGGMDQGGGEAPE